METPRTLKAQAINVDIPADSRFLVALRVLARTAGALVDLSIDRIEDMQLAVDEAATLLVGLAGADSTSPLTAEFLLMPSELSARLSVSCPAGSTLDEDSLGWLVLTGLGFPVSVLQEDGRACIQVTSNPSQSHTCFVCGYFRRVNQLSRLDPVSESLSRRRLAGVVGQSLAARDSLRQAVRIAHESGLTWPEIAATIREAGRWPSDPATDRRLAAITLLRVGAWTAESGVHEEVG